MTRGPERGRKPAGGTARRGGAGRALVLAAAVAVSGPAARASSPFLFDLGCLASRQVDVDGRVRTRALGPLVEWTSGKDGYALKAVRPLFAASEHPETGWRRWEFAWPVATAKRLEDKERSWRVLLAYGYRFDLASPAGRRRLWVLPFYFQGRDLHGRRYLAVFPLGGRIREFLWQDTIDFALFPLWMRSQVNDVVTHDVLWPFLSRTRGGGVRRHRVLPFYGYSYRPGRFEKRFVLWPVFTSATYLPPGAEGRAFMVFPLWARVRLTGQSTWAVLPPFFRVDRNQRLRSVAAPWPFLRYSSGEVDQFHLWPLFGRKRRQGIQNSFLLWPLGWREKIDRGPWVLRRYKVLPFYQYEVQRARRAGPGGERAVRSRDVHVWPLGSYRRVEDRRRLRVLDLWPVKNQAPVERNWAPLWTLFEHRARGADSETELLWGLYRRSRREGGTSARRSSPSSSGTGTRAGGRSAGRGRC